MVERSLPRARTRIQRGILLFRERGEEIAKHGDLWTVPGNGTYWTVNPECESCDCPDYKRRYEDGDTSPCKHMYALMLVLAKRRA